MITNNMTLTGELLVQIHDDSGQLVSEQLIKNLVVDAGKNLVASRLKDNTSAAIGWMAVGTSNTAASAGQTTLVAEVARVALTSSTVSTNTIAYVGTFPAGTGTGTLLEAGLFNDGTAGTMLSRTAGINVVKSSTDSLTITWTIIVS